MADCWHVLHRGLRKWGLISRTVRSSSWWCGGPPPSGFTSRGTQTEEAPTDTTEFVF